MAGELNGTGHAGAGHRPSRRRKADEPARVARGFSLIELMVVVTIISVLSVGAILAIGGADRLLPGAQPGDLTGYRDRLAGALARGRDAALFGRGRAGLQPLETGWQVTAYDPANARWRPILSESLPGMSLGWTVAGQVYPAPDAAPDRGPPIRILADGRLTTFSLRLSAERQSLTCRATGVSDLHCGAP